MTATDQETDVLEALDFDHEQPCDFHQCKFGDAPNPAEFKLVFACCGTVAFGCDPCVKHALDWGNSGGHFWCETCGAHGIKGNPFSLIERIEK